MVDRDLLPFASVSFYGTSIFQDFFIFIQQDISFQNFPQHREIGSIAVWL